MNFRHADFCHVTFIFIEICLCVNACLLLCDCCHGEQLSSDFSMYVTLSMG